MYTIWELKTRTRPQCTMPVRARSTRPSSYCSTCEAKKSDTSHTHAHTHTHTHRVTGCEAKKSDASHTESGWFGGRFLDGHVRMAVQYPHTQLHHATNYFTPEIYRYKNRADRCAHRGVCASQELTQHSVCSQSGRWRCSSTAL